MGQETRSVEEILAGWNKPSVDHGLGLMVGDLVPDGDGRATAAHGTGDGNPSTGEDSEPETYTGDDWKKKDLQAEIDKRNAAREDEDDHIVPESDKNSDLIAALVEDDEWLASLGGPEAPEDDD